MRKELNYLNRLTRETLDNGICNSYKIKCPFALWVFGQKNKEVINKQTRLSDSMIQERNYVPGKKDSQKT